MVLLTPRSSRRRALLAGTALLALAACRDPVGVEGARLEPGVYVGLDLDYDQYSTGFPALAEQLTILPGGTYRFYQRRECFKCGYTHAFWDAREYTQTSRGARFPKLGWIDAQFVGRMRGDTVVVTMTPAGGEARQRRFVRIAAPERARIVELMQAPSWAGRFTLRLVPTARTATEITYALPEEDLAPRVLAAVDANGAVWSPGDIRDVLRVEAPAGWEVAGTVVRPPAREERAAVTLRADDATATYGFRVLRDLRTVPFQLTFACLGTSRFAPAGSPAQDSMRVVASARIDFGDEPAYPGGPLPFTTLTYTGSQIRYRTDGIVDTVAVTRTLASVAQAPDTLLLPAAYDAPTARHMVLASTRPLRYVGGAVCDFGYAGFRDAELTEVLP